MCTYHTDHLLKSKIVALAASMYYRSHIFSYLNFQG